MSVTGLWDKPADKSVKAYPNKSKDFHPTALLISSKRLEGTCSALILSLRNNKLLPMCTDIPSKSGEDMHVQ